MSEESETDRCCYSCGIAEGDDIKLRTCTACKSARYCSVKCQKEHWPQHKRQCKKRAAELRDELLFKQPESTHLGDCPICMIPLSLDLDYSSMQTCCSKTVCDGCAHANVMREIQGMLESKCPFCRTPSPNSEADARVNETKRMEANDPVAMRQEGSRYYTRGEYRSAFEYFTKAVELGDVEAHYPLSVLYHDGQGVARNEKKEIFHLEEAAIGGHPSARYNLGVIEGRRYGRFERAQKHYVIAANQGHDGSVRSLLENHKRGFVKKEVLDAALRAHQAAVDATKSPQREEAKKEYNLN
eukprot:CAMPEP_0201697720 /NCGR_PEP_ID=MMETSP0578-20130828/13012_1 /ASSEMBLY_ACC=CAM_ASM_000663 /TAXON_ID=267565 /ORGANISM="Skeletonema grethea, Strain CCMP 1804" /LENGTH=298 /DNA_ID=CAMNT_0048183981 /DNA_START=109 /DNA_END=1005 /DNA_ORIENTATION=+